MRTICRLPPRRMPVSMERCCVVSDARKTSGRVQVEDVVSGALKRRETAEAESGGLPSVLGSVGSCVAVVNVSSLPLPDNQMATAGGAMAPPEMR